MALNAKLKRNGGFERQTKKKMVALNAKLKKKMVALNAKLKRNSGSERQTIGNGGFERQTRDATRNAKLKRITLNVVNGSGRRF